MLEIYGGLGDRHPIMRAAWLHHAFVVIHPFDDSNGRVARALELPVLVQGRYAPIVVDRESRSDYLAALSDANDGDLRALVRLFARLEIVALRSELVPPDVAAPLGGALEIAQAHVARRAARRQIAASEVAARVQSVGDELSQRLTAELRLLAQALEQEFRSIDPQARALVDSADLGTDRAQWWRHQVIRAAKAADFFVDRMAGVWWCRLRLSVEQQRLRFVLVVQKVGRGDAGVLAVTVFAEVMTVEAEAAENAPWPIDVLRGSADSVTLVYTEDLAVRWPEVQGLLERSLAAAVADFVADLK